MGLFGGGNSKRTTINEDNRTINDYSGSEFDMSQDNSIDGNANNNTGTLNITTIDAGAFDIVDNSNARMASLSETGMQLGYEIGALGVDAGVQLGESSMSFADSVNSESLGFADGVISDAATIIDNQSSRSLDAALAVHSTGLQQLSMGSELAYGLASLNQDAALEQQNDNNNALTNGFKSMMQFADSYSRSDGASIAENNTKMMMFVAGVVGLGFIAKQYFN